ncbi:aspartyl-phosphate phosphatase Spo0E family protein [Paenibacillus sp. GCM10027626]|uniref:aspartyl-phosphate phosphatase Spo0E family protein n=1 Tax=Paenibacillus sp. GCM10027626 TaxID=3273411 RepID=UPI0036389878
MACADCEHSLLGAPGSKQAKQYSSSVQVLEDEIYALRQMMEHSYREQDTINSDVMIDISRKLDIKINEYMQLRLILSSLRT